MADWVLDSSAVLATLRGEPGGAEVETLLPDSVVCSVNVAEVVSKLVDFGYGEASVVARIQTGSFSTALFDQALAVRAGLLRSMTRRLGLSLGDRACLALAEREGLPVLTADRSWASLDIGLEIRLIR